MTCADYQRFRLWSGIFSIGTNLGLIWAFAIFFTFAGDRVVERIPFWLWLLAPVVAFLVLGFVFDLLSGHVAERALGHSTLTSRDWLADWLQTAPRAALGLAGALLVFWFCAALSPLTRAFVVAFVPLIALFLAIIVPFFVPSRWKNSGPAQRDFEAVLQLELRELGVPDAPIVWLQSEDEKSVNGAIAPLGRAVWLCDNVARQLSPREAALLVARDFWLFRSGKNAVNRTICAVWLGTGAALALLLPPQNNALAFATTAAAISTTWCFAALFVWPRLNQKWGRAADRYLLQYAPKSELAALFQKVQSLNASDTALSSVKSGVFHPIPELARRLENLK